MDIRKKNINKKKNQKIKKVEFQYSKKVQKIQKIKKKNRKISKNQQKKVQKTKIPKKMSENFPTIFVQKANPFFLFLFVAIKYRTIHVT